MVRLCYHDKYLKVKLQNLFPKCDYHTYTPEAQDCCCFVIVFLLLNWGHTNVKKISGYKVTDHTILISLKGGTEGYGSF
jgi:hypothetical protein